MNQKQRFNAICAALENPAVYPHPVKRVERRDTHISSVFLTGEWVYKLKKPVDLGFLDFRRLSDRKDFCEREVALNQRLSHGVYVKVVSILESEENRFSFEGRGNIVEYAVKMRQLSDNDNLKQRLEKNEVGLDHMQSLGKALAAFYNGSDRSPQIDYYGRPEVISLNMEENFKQLEAFVGDLLSHNNWELLCQVSRSFLRNHRRLFNRRLETGHICDGHGDLRADHVYFHRGLQIIDCIEFNNRFRYGDRAVDLAFLFMDMEHLGHSGLGRAFLAAYVEETDDPGIYALIDFYATYRALVRLKVIALHRQEVQPVEQMALRIEAERYVEQAYQYVIRFSRPTLWIFCGLPATGKSSLAEALGEALAINVFQSDFIRREDRGRANHRIAPFGKGLYRRGMRQRVYTKLLALSQDALKAGRSVVLDATFSYQKWRDEARRLSADLGTNILFAECLCREKTMRSRLQSRKGVPGLSDARLEHFAHMKKEFELLEELPDDIHLKVGTEQPLRHALAEVLSEGYSLKCRQIQNLMASGVLGS